MLLLAPLSDDQQSDKERSMKVKAEQLILAADTDLLSTDTSRLAFVILFLLFSLCALAAYTEAESGCYWTLPNEDCYKNCVH